MQTNIMPALAIGTDDHDYSSEAWHSQQFQNALKAGDLDGKSGLYVIQPGWTGRNLFKMGLTKNIKTRVFSGYRHSMPYAAGSFDLRAFMVVHPTFNLAREKEMHTVTFNRDGWLKWPFDKEWREVHNASDAHVNEMLKKLFLQIHKQTDGYIYIFDRDGAIVYKGGIQRINYNLVQPLVSKHQTRTATTVGHRQPGAPATVDPNAPQLIAPAGTRRLRNIPAAQRQALTKQYTKK